MAARILLVLLNLSAASPLTPQSLFDGEPGQPPRIQSSDRAILAASGNRNDIACRVEPLTPHLDFELKYQAGYLVHIPAEAVPPSGDRFRVLFRIRPLEAPQAEPVYFRQSFAVPPLEETADGVAVFPGRYVLGPGQYAIDWLMRNQQGRVCSAHWRARAAPPSQTGEIAIAPTANLIAPFRPTVFADEPPVVRGDAASLLHVSVLVNLAPLDRARFRISEYELESIVAMLRSLHREPRLGLFSLTAFSAHDRQVVYSAQRSSRLDFAALGEAIESMSTGIVSLADLADPESEPRFLARVLNEALGPRPDPPDAVIVLGPKIDRETRVPEESLDFGRPPPLFQFVLDRNPHSYPWDGSFETALKQHGLTVYNITRPQEYSRSLEDLMRRLAPPEPVQGLPEELPGPARARALDRP